VIRVDKDFLTSVKNFSRKLQKKRKIGMANIFSSRPEYCRIILQVNLRARVGLAWCRRCGILQLYRHPRPLAGIKALRQSCMQDCQWQQAVCGRTVIGCLVLNVRVLLVSFHCCYSLLPRSSEDCENGKGRNPSASESLEHRKPLKSFMALVLQ
jgi:hypothetical protein